MELQTAVAVELKPEAKKLAFVQPGRLKPSVPFSQTKGLLPSPAEGILVRNFGDPDSYGGTSQGIAIETRDKAQVTAPCDGWVVYADNLRNYGQVLIINAGGGYHILLAGMDRIQASLGQFVLAGEPIAIMGSRKNPDETGGTAKKPILYIEFRKNQKPVDPSPWWSSRADVEKG
jgi:septal ring factor EnvC (AmiA/AmiB activator)